MGLGQKPRSGFSTLKRQVSGVLAEKDEKEESDASGIVSARSGWGDGGLGDDGVGSAGTMKSASEPLKSTTGIHLPSTFLLVFISAAVAWWARPLLPVDETRYLSVAWEMWRTGDFLVPHLNGETYSHKPPLLFWLIDGGWGAFGVNLWWPRHLGFIFLVADGLLIRRLVGRLWPGEQNPAMGNTAAAIFLSSLIPFIFGTVVMFDLLLLLWVLIGWLALVEVARGAPLVRGLLMMGVAVGLGILAKGPVVLLFLLLPSLTAIYWCEKIPGRARAVIVTAIGGAVVGVALALAWAIPAGNAGGPAYHDAIFWGQTVGRMNESFAHARPWFWYLAVLPAMMLPWTLLPGCWRGWRGNRPSKPDSRSGPWRFLFWSGVPAFIFLSLVSGKQPHYLLPMVAILSCALGIHLTVHPGSESGSRWSQLGPAALLLLFGVMLLLLPTLAREREELSWLTVGWTPIAGALLVVAAPLWLIVAGRGKWRLMQTALLIPLLMASIHLALNRPLKVAYDMGPLAARVASWQEKGEMVVFFGARYHGQFTFSGRLTEPVANPHNLEDLIDWAAIHPDGNLIVVVKRNSRASFSAAAAEILPYMTTRVAIWRAADFVAAQ